MSLYRKYRPKAFDDVYGQQHIVTTLSHAIEKDKLVHAYLFAGTRGTGKTSVARILAKHLMLRGIEDDVMKKQIEKGVEDGSIVDLLEIDAASNRGIDHVRDLIEKIQFSPVVAGAKVYIIDEVHMLTKESFNALLKTLEEPPEYAYFILATTEFNKIPETIKSRCQCLPFKHVSESNIVRRLQFIADQEGLTVERDALKAIAHVSDGGMRDAISLLDQMRSLDAITLDDVKKRLGTTGQEFVDTTLEAIQGGDRSTVLRTVKALEENGVPMDVFARQLLSELRERLHNHIEAKKETEHTLQMMNALLAAIKDLRASPVPALTLEGALLSLCGTEATEKVESGKWKVENEKEIKEVKEVKEVEESKEIEAIEDPSPSPSPSPSITLDAIHNSWSSVINQTQPASVKMSLKNGRVKAVNENRIQIEFTSAFHKDKVAEASASKAVEDVLLSLFEQKLKIECTVEAQKQSAKQAEETLSPAKKEDNDVVSLADAAAEIF